MSNLIAPHTCSIPKKAAKRILIMSFAGQSFVLAGCGGAPAITVAGAYFPAWLLCAIIGVLIAVFARAFMVATGLSKLIPFQLAVCCSVGIVFALILWRFWGGD